MMKFDAGIMIEVNHLSKREKEKSRIQTFVQLYQFIAYLLSAHCFADWKKKKKNEKYEKQKSGEKIKYIILYSYSCFLLLISH